MPRAKRLLSDRPVKGSVDAADHTSASIGPPCAFAFSHVVFSLSIDEFHELNRTVNSHGCEFLRSWLEEVKVPRLKARWKYCSGGPTKNTSRAAISGVCVCVCVCALRGLSSKLGFNGSPHHCSASSYLLPCRRAVASSRWLIREAGSASQTHTPPPAPTAVRAHAHNERQRCVDLSIRARGRAHEEKKVCLCAQ